MTYSEQEASKQFAEGMWKLIMARGIFLIVVGLILLFFPKGTLTTLIFILGIYLFIDGIVTVVKAVQRRKIYRNWWWGVLAGGLAIIAGVIVFTKPLSSTVLTTSFLMWFLGIVAIINGILTLITGIKLNRINPNEHPTIWGSIFSIVIGAILISAPFTSALVVIKVIGSFALFAGVITVFLAKRIKTKTEKIYTK